MAEPWQEYSSPTHILRVKNDVRDFYKKNSTDLFIDVDKYDPCVIHALIIGPKGTPYEGGFFYFVLTYEIFYNFFHFAAYLTDNIFFRIPHNYPIHPPKVELKTTLDENLCFYPNFVVNGQVRLSILRTYYGTHLFQFEKYFGLTLNGFSRFELVSYTNHWFDPIRYSEYNDDLFGGP